MLTSYFTKGAQRLRKIWVDGNYSGHTPQAWVARLKQTHKVVFERVENTGLGLSLVKRRWGLSVRSLGYLTTAVIRKIMSG